MTETIQTRFTSILTERLSALGFELLFEHGYTNTGVAHVTPVGGLTPVLSFSYHFQEGHNYFKTKDDPVWPDENTNPHVFIARVPAELETCLAQIVEYVTRLRCA